MIGYSSTKTITMSLLNILLPKRKREKEELKKLEPEIKNLEEKLGLTERDTKTLFYDPHYIRNKSFQTRKDYLEE